MKRIFTYMIIILLITSIYKDLSLGTGNKTSVKDEISPNEAMYNNNDFSIIQIKVTHGDTVLSIMESINDEINNVEKIIADFQVLNPNTPPQQIRPGEIYYFPKYNTP